MFFLGTNAIPPSWSLILPESWGESKTGKEVASEFLLKNACSADYRILSYTLRLERINQRNFVSLDLSILNQIINDLLMLVSL